jgi:hypothetical protein
MIEHADADAHAKHSLAGSLRTWISLRDDGFASRHDDASLARLDAFAFLTKALPSLRKRLWCGLQRAAATRPDADVFLSKNSPAIPRPTAKHQDQGSPDG